MIISRNIKNTVMTWDNYQKLHNVIDDKLARLQYLCIWTYPILLLDELLTIYKKTKLCGAHTFFQTRRKISSIYFQKYLFPNYVEISTEKLNFTLLIFLLRWRRERLSSLGVIQEFYQKILKKVSAPNWRYHYAMLGLGRPTSWDKYS